MQHQDKPINVLELMDGIEFPISREYIIIHASNQGASEEALNLIRALPEKDYSDMQDMNVELGRIREPIGADNIFASTQNHELSDTTDMQKIAKLS